MQQIETECVRAVETLQRRVRSELPSRFEPAMAEHCAEVRDALAAQVDLLLAQSEKFLSAQDLSELADRGEKVAGEHLHTWLANHQAEFEEALWTLASDGVDQLARLYDEALEFGSELFGLPPPAARWSISKDEAEFSWRVAAPFEWRPRLGWELDVLPVRWVRRRARRGLGRTLEAAAAAYRDRVAQALAEAGSSWAGSLISEVQDALRSLGTQVGAVIEGQAASAISGKAGALLRRLEAMREELTGEGGHGKPTAPASLLPAGERRAVRRCFVCERIVAELFDFFSKRQYELSMNEAQQREHAGNGGFCSLHTWQYERIASPQGVCLAYAPLLADIAHHLRSIASSASSPRSMRDRIRDLYPSANRCPACRRATEAEKTAVEELRQVSASREGGEAGGGLCVRHLGTVLDRETDLETARNLVLEQANTLDRTSENMQTYSLKRDAVEWELVSDEERMAYLLGLSLLVGHRTLSAAS